MPYLLIFVSKPDGPVRKKYSKTACLLYKIRIFGWKYVIRTVFRENYCTIYVLI
jgi:hypothetical protein